MLKFIKETIKSVVTKIEGFELVDTGRANNLDIEVLKALRTKTDDQDILSQLDMDIKRFESGEYGENGVLYELKNSDIPMRCFQNVHIKLEDRTAQIDFLVVTHNFICTIEVKSLSGDLKVHADGRFERFIKNKNGKLIKRESMYSPIEQNARHARILRKMLVNEKLIKNCPVHNLVVLARSEGNLDLKYAKKDIKNSIVRKDQLRNKLIEYSCAKDSMNMPYQTVLNIVDFIKEHDKQASSEYNNPKIYKYSKMIVEEMLSRKTKSKVVQSIDEQPKKTEAIVEKAKPEVVVIEKSKSATTTSNDDELITRLKKYRKWEAERNSIKPYMVFYDAHLEDIIRKKPTTLAELKDVHGFGDKKVEKYGQYIIRIVGEHVGG